MMVIQGGDVDPVVDPDVSVSYRIWACN